jgi:NAD(P)-dependent dehydrogenase (short-subunit alcohol dehydrogenase family)
MTGTFQGRAILVTGAASGIGRAAAIRFAQEGGQVAVADLNGDGARRVAAEIGGSAIAIEADVAKEADNQRMVEEVHRHFGRLDIAFLNAGYLGPMNGFAGTDLQLFERHLSINLTGVFLGLKAVEPKIESGGAVVVTGSTAGLLGLAESPGYTAAKHGVIGLVKASAPSFAARGARINVICPGGVATPMMGGADPPIVAPHDLPRVKMRSMGTAQHVAEMALWLASPAAGFVHGQAHLIEGGLLSTFVESPPGP